MDGVSSAEIAEINFLKPITCKLFCRAMDEIRIGCRCRNEGRIKRPAFLTKETENASFNSCPSDWRQRLDRLRGTGLSPAAGWRRTWWRFGRYSGRRHRRFRPLRRVPALRQIGRAHV